MRISPCRDHFFLADVRTGQAAEVTNQYLLASYADKCILVACSGAEEVQCALFGGHSCDQNGLKFDTIALKTVKLMQVVKCVRVFLFC